ncbi:hypothetical protein [Shewanella waksmanii]|uniref:hypothetical protein n=1 Tax=Shewanella waksmanii TaxID=213783 RepID=UPI00048FEE93|nr:hypothetical protein [Shewanella waksmanii]
MLTTLPTSHYRLDHILLYHFLLLTAISLLILPLFEHDNTLVLMLLVSLQIVLTCINTLISVSFGQRIERIALSVLFALWMTVWLVHLN